MVHFARSLLTLAAALPCAAQLAPVKVLGHTPALGYVRWNDPRENAFHAEVPRGWTVSGGLARNSPIDARQTLVATSPDGIRMTLGDARVPASIVPHPMLSQTGFPEGARYPNGFGGHMLVRRFLPGAAFAEEYARSMVSGAGCSGTEVIDRRARPELAESLNRLMSILPGVRLRMETGEVAFTCTSNGQPYTGYYFAGTMLSQGSNGMGIWAVQVLHGFVAPSGRVGVAVAALRRMVESHRQNPEWAAMQSKITMESSRVIAQTNAETSRVISDSYWTRQRSMDRVFRKDANARRGTTDVSDPNTGETWNITGGSRYYWRKQGSDVVVGTDSPNSPGVGYTALNEN